MGNGAAMTRRQIIELFVGEIPRDRSHMFCYFSACAANGDVRPFVESLVAALHRIESAEPGYAAHIIRRISSIRGIGENPFESIIQVLCEVFVVSGAIEIADVNAASPLFESEPGAPGARNPEFEVRISGHWLAVEVKAPRMIEYARKRDEAKIQMTARLPNGHNFGDLLPRDNPVKDFLASAQAKFEAYRTHRLDSYCLLMVIWDDFVQEPIAALLNPNSGLFTENSFCTTAAGIPEAFDLVDGVVLIRHQHQLIRATREEPLLDGQEPFRFHGPPFPPKALVPNPNGRTLPGALCDALGLIPYDQIAGAEYRPPDLVIWI